MAVQAADGAQAAVEALSGPRSQIRVECKSRACRPQALLLSPEIQSVPSLYKSQSMTQSMSTDSASGPLFVVGIWRSGTSLLNQHPLIALLYEGELPVMRALFSGGHAKSDWLERWDFWNQGASRHGIDGSAIAPGLDIRSTTEAVCKQYAARKGAAIWGCKSPQYYDCLPQLAGEFPNAKF